MSRLLLIVFSLWFCLAETREIPVFEYADTEPLPWTILYTIHPMYNAQSYLEVWKNNGNDNTVPKEDRDNAKQGDKSTYFEGTKSNNATSRWSVSQNFTTGGNLVNKFSNEDKQPQTNRIWRTASAL